MNPQILASVGQILEIRQWVFEKSGSSALALGRQLARSGKFAAALDLSFIKDCESYRTVAVVYTFTSLLSLILKDNPPGCTWMVLSEFSPQFASQLPPLNTLVIFLNDRDLTLTTVHRPCLECRVNIKKMNISSGSQINMDELTKLLLINDRDLRGARINVSLDSPRNCDPPIDDRFTRIQCFHLEALEMIGQMNNYHLSKVSPRYPESPFNFPNGSDGEILIQLRKRLVDVSVASLVVTAQRCYYLDFVWPSIELKAVMYVAEGSEGVRWLSYIDPLSLGVWLATAACVLLSGALLALSSYFDISDHHGPFSAIFRVFNALQLFCYQALQEVPRATSGRIIHYILLITALVLLPAYSGSLISFITVHRQHVPFTTFEEFVSDGRFKILTRSNQFLDYYLRRVIPNGTNLAVPLEERTILAQEGFNKICGGWQSYLTEVVEFSPSIHNYHCGVQELPITIMTEYFGFGIPKKSPLKNRLAVGNLHVISTGITDRLRQSILRDSKLFAADRAFTAVTFPQTLPIFGLLLCFFSLALLLFAAEKVFYL